MYGVNSFITIWNRYNNMFFRHEIKTLCRFKQKSLNDVKNANKRDMFIVSIPFLNNFVAPDIWNKLNDIDKASYFTVQTEDYIAKGLHSIETDDPLELRDILQNQIFKINFVGYNMEVEFGKHIRAEGI